MYKLTRIDTLTCRLAVTYRHKHSDKETCRQTDTDTDVETWTGSDLRQKCAFTKF